MYDTEEPVPVTLVCENEVMKGVLDAFGMDIKVKRAEKGAFPNDGDGLHIPNFLRMGVSVGKAESGSRRRRKLFRHTPQWPERFLKE